MNSATNGPRVEACRAVISGRVQGVWFRDSTRREAERLGVTGWVRNLADGSVEAEFYGTSDMLKTMLAWCHKGPPMARVDAVRVQSLPMEGVDPPPGFIVRY